MSVRSGSLRSAGMTASRRPATTNMAPSQGRPDATKNAAIISIDDLERIRAQCDMGRQHTYKENRNAERKQLQGVSNSRVKNWPNTIEAMRLKREEDRIRRLEDDELERRAVDAKEEQYQAELRSRQLERTNKQLHDEQDMVIAFKSKMLMCDVAQEQNAQKELRKRKKKIEEEIERHWIDIEKQKMSDYDHKTRDKLEKEYSKKMDNAQMISQQLEEFKLNYIKKLKEDMLEGELIKRQVDEDLEREKQKEIMRQKRSAEMKAELVKANKAMIEAEERERIRLIAEGAKIAEHARKRAALEQLKKEREQHKFQEKQDTRQKMIDRQIEELRQLKSTEEEVLSKQVADAEHKANRLYEDQQKKRVEMKESIERSRKLQIDRKHQKAATVKQEEKEFSQFWANRNEELLVAEQQEKEETRMRNEEMSRFLQKQAQVKQDKVIKEFKEEQYSGLQATALLDQNEKNFYSYTEKCIKEWQAQGKNVKPLIMELKNYKKRIL